MLGIGDWLLLSGELTRRCHAPIWEFLNRYEKETSIRQ